MSEVLAVLVAAAGGALLAPTLAAIARGALRGGSEGSWWPGPVLVRVACAGAFGAVTALCGLEASLPAWLAFAAFGLMLTFTDLSAHRLPNRLVAAFAAVAAALLTLAAAITGEWSRLLTAAVAAVVLVLAFGALALVHRAGLGFGDVKLAGPVGLYLGWLGWPAVLIGVCAAFVLAAIVALTVAAIRRTGRSTAIAFGPYLLGGVAVCLLLGST